eukprot:5869257-Amphidinium_carterae.1
MELAHVLGPSREPPFPCSTAETLVWRSILLSVSLRPVSFEFQKSSELLQQRHKSLNETSGMGSLRERFWHFGEKEQAASDLKEQG